MTTYPHRYGDTDRAVEHYATACVASARVLRSEGHQREAADLVAEAQLALTGIDHPDRQQPPHHEPHPEDRSDSDVDLAFEADVPGWWR
ncbi:hypothetical protein [Phycicoccus sonneratiae]|uniref:Tetratricopeptide repeat protein n=1 Tax=Phycicoccus sonneratiae TaxID=2807628 RepID=A0ABS2CT27_9MICO|nr:hypothetical protein [Phycicoccus sonneraticus]MBM6402613.1 hypothetical protein [Phycicoccus sonneraticus]